MTAHEKIRRRPPVSVCQAAAHTVPRRVICEPVLPRSHGWLFALMFDMEVIVRRQGREHCASITCMIRHYVARRAKVIEDHPHNADERTTVPVDTAEGGRVVRLAHLLRLNPPDGRSSHIEWQPEGHRRL